MALKERLACPAGHEGESERDDRRGRCGRCGAPMISARYDDASKELNKIDAATGRLRSPTGEDLSRGSR